MRVLLTVAVLLALCSTVARGEPAPRKVLAADYGTKRLGLVNAEGKLEWELPIRDIHDLWALPNGHVLYQKSWTEIVEVNADRQPVWEYNAAKSNGNDGKKVEVHAFERLENGHTMIAESGPARIIEVDREGKLQHEIKLVVKQPNVHRDTRLVRRVPSGGYLVAHEGDGMVREYNREGRVTWEYNVGSQVYSAVRLANGNTLIGTGGGHRVLEVSPDGKEAWSINESELPGVKLAWVTMVERLSNGNTLVVNCHAGKENPQIVEVTPEKKVVWSFRDFTHFGNALPVARVLP